LFRKNDGQLNFFDQEIFSKMIPQDHPLVKIKNNVDLSFVDQEVACHYSPDTGRPCIPPSVLFRILFLEIWANLSDVQVCRELQYNVLYRWFCDLAWSDPVPDPSTLVVFRRRLGEEGFRRLFDRLVEDLQAKGFIKGKWVLVDGTKLVAHAAAKNTLTLVREGRARLLKALAQKSLEEAKKLSRYAEPLPDREYSSQAELLAAEKEVGRELVAALKQHKEVPALKEELAFYERVLNGEGVGSFADPDARWGFKKKNEPFFGYKVYATATEEGFVTAVKVTPGNEAEAPQLPELVEETSRKGLRPRRLAADKGYDYPNIHEYLQERNIRPYIPERASAKKETGFTYDGEKDCMVCPQGKVSIGKTEHQNGGYIYYFSKKDCQKCPLKQGCLGEGSTHKRVYRNESPLKKVRAKCLKVAMRVRKEIERVFGHAKTWHKMSRARYRGIKRVALQVFLTFMVINAKKAALIG
jgi:transposase